MQLIKVPSWKDYELIDSGQGEKLERFGPYITVRPEPQAIWNSSLAKSEWEKMYHAHFSRNTENVKSNKEDSGRWNIRKGMPEQWTMEWQFEQQAPLKFRLGLTSFKHVGLFPEQSENWRYIYSSIRQLKMAQPKVLNLFAYTGAASLAARAAGAEVTHVDSVKQVINWSRENMELSGLKDIRWVVEDALKFAQREARRGKKYQGIMLDPPSYGRGPEGEIWKLEKDINALLEACAQLCDTHCFVILNLYSVEISPLMAENLFKQYFTAFRDYELGELYLEDRYAKKLPMGSLVRALK